MQRNPVVVLVERNHPPVLEEVELQGPGPGEVVVDLRASGICRTDLAAVRAARTVPVVLGREGAGIVTAVGPSGSNVRFCPGEDE